ncbi:MAG: hypothetical protein A2068_00370 [Ignavibacteria bacterium GWB2_35_6b]|nr:MAG: hypothetical protein A2068_00370 [Ignavibacteria bacterium GWB2_35_6b]
MLEKIANINSNNPYGGGKKKSGNFEKFLSKPHIEKEFGRDSISLSPGAIYLSRINWQLKEINQGDEKVVVEFIIDGFDIFAEVDFVNFYTNSRQKFKVATKQVDSWENKKSLIVFDVHKGQIMLEDDRRLVELGALKKIYEKISNSFSGGGSDINYTSIIESLKDELTLEFQIITNHLYTFINKLGKYNIVNEFVFNREHEEPIRIERVTAINAK